MRPPHFPVTQIKGIYFKNPFVVLPRATELTFPNGRVTPEILMFYKAFAQSEAAMVITGPATILPPNSRKYSLLRVDQPKYLDGLRALCKIIQSNGAIPGVQVLHPGPFDANRLLDGPVGLDWDLEPHVTDKLITMYRNACARSVEVGYRYVELNACDNFVLHRLLLDDHEDLVRNIFKASVESMVETYILGLRLHPGIPELEKYARMFLSMGGDVIAYQEGAEHGLDLPSIRQVNMMQTIYELTPSRSVLNMMEFNALVGMPAAFPRKQRQVLSYFQG